MRKPNQQIPYQHIPTYCLKMKLERIDDLCEKISSEIYDVEFKGLSEDDLRHIRSILRETQHCIKNLYYERML